MKALRYIVMFLTIMVISFDLSAKLKTGYTSMDVKLAELAKGVPEAGTEIEETEEQMAGEKAIEAVLESDANERDLVVPQRLALGKFSLTSPDINVFMKARIREEYITLHSALTFRHDYPDYLDMIRQKVSLYLYAIQGLQRYGKASTEAFFKLTSYNFWQDDGYFTQMSEEDIGMNMLEPNKRVRFMDDHKHKLLQPLIFFEDVWLNIHFGTFMSKALEDHPLDFKIGYFEYILGRGLTLGNYYDVGVDTLGWKGQGGALRFPQSPPGALLRFKLFDSLDLDLYYTKWTETNDYPTYTREMLDTQLLKDHGDDKTPFDTGNTWRGKTKDQESWAARLDYTHESDSWGTLNLQPYFMWTRAPEQGIELKADVASKFGTAGMMIDWQCGGFRMNFEGAFQFGHQDVYGIDRNVIEIERKDDGSLQEVYSNIYYDSTPLQSYIGPYVASQKAPISSGLTEIINNSFNNKPARNGQPILDDSGNIYNEGASSFYNSDVLGQERYRKDFKINYEGFMLNFDMSYEWKKGHLKPAMTLGYISGDDYPYNYPYNNRNYKGFITLRDQNYWGLEVMSYAMLEARFMPRPLNLSYHKAYAYNHSNDASNLGIIGGGLTWHPFKRKEKLFFIANALGFWSTKSMYKWNPEGYDAFNSAPLDILSGDNTTPIPFLGLTQRQFHQQVIRSGMASLHVGENQDGVGWVSTDQKASSYLGTELNIRMEMHFEDSLEFLIRGAIFLNGTTYNDLYYQPNRNTRRTDYKGNKFYESLGTSNAWGLHSSLTYRF